MKISDELLCLFSAEVREDGDGDVIEVPRREVETGSVSPGDVYRIALISRTEGGALYSFITGKPSYEQRAAAAKAFSEQEAQEAKAAEAAAEASSEATPAEAAE